MGRTTEPCRHGGGKNSNLTQCDLQMIETIKRERSTLSLREIYNELTEFGDIPKGTSRLAERFTEENMAYTQMFIDYLHAKDPFNLKFFNE